MIFFANLRLWPASQLRKKVVKKVDFFGPKMKKTLEMEIFIKYIKYIKYEIYQIKCYLKHANMKFLNELLYEIFNKKRI